MRRLPVLVVLVALTFVPWDTSAGVGTTDSVPTLNNFQLVGHNPLNMRGMNAAPAIFDHYIYVGNRTDGSANHINPGILVVDIANPANPTVVGEIGPPNAGNRSETTRELRVWPQAQLLMSMNFGCSAIIHACVSTSDVSSMVTPTIRFFDLSQTPQQPPLISTYLPTRTPHEMFLWLDPARPGRALLFQSTPTSSTTQPNLIVTDISRAREGVFTEIVRWRGNDLFPAADRNTFDVRLHSMGVSADGNRTYLAYLGGGFLILDTSDVANNLANPEIRLATPIENRLSWGNPGAHSAVKVPGKSLVLMTDEVYGDLLDPITGDNHGCPWGWVRIINTAVESRPVIISEYKLPQNEAAYCQTPDGMDPSNTFATSYSSHNPTVLRQVAFVTWHSGGFQAINLANPSAPTQAGVFSPDPLPFVVTEDPALSEGRNKVVMWSYPIIKDGLIYLIDLRNGLYILRYTGPAAEFVDRITFLEGNSNLGDAARLERTSRPRTPSIGGPGG
jgi:hypothetical protein